MYSKTAICVPLAVLVAASCAGTSKTSDEPLTEQPSPPDSADIERQQIDAFVESLETEPSATVVTHRVNLDDQLPLELVVEERCLAHECDFGPIKVDTVEQKAQVRFRVFDISLIDQPTPVGEPFTATRRASLHAVRASTEEPRTLIVRESLVPLLSLSRGELGNVRYRYVTGTRDTEKLDEWCGALTRGRTQLSEIPVFADIDSDGADELVMLGGGVTTLSFGVVDLRTPIAIGNVCADVADEALVREEDVPGAVRFADALERAGANLEADPNEMAEILAVGAVLGLDAPSLSEEIIRSLSAAFDRRTAAGRTMVSVTDWDGGPRSTGTWYGFDQCPMPDDAGMDAAMDCVRQRIDRYETRYQASDALGQLVHVLALRWHEQPAVASWARQALERAQTPTDVSVLAQLAAWSVPATKRSEWVEKAVSDSLGTLGNGSVPEPGSTDPKTLSLTEEQRALATISGVYTSGFDPPEHMRWPYPGAIAPWDAYWDASAVFESFVEAQWPKTDTLVELIRYPFLWNALVPAILSRDRGAFSDALIRELIHPRKYRVFDGFEPTDEGNLVRDQARLLILEHLQNPRTIAGALTLASECSSVNARRADLVHRRPRATGEYGCREAFDSLYRAHRKYEGTDDVFGAVIVIGTMNWHELSPEVREWWLSSANDDMRLETARQVSSGQERWKITAGEKFELLIEVVDYVDDPVVLTSVVVDTARLAREMVLRPEQTAALDAAFVRALRDTEGVQDYRVAALLEGTQTLDKPSPDLRSALRLYSNDSRQRVRDAAREALD